MGVSGVDQQYLGAAVLQDVLQFGDRKTSIEGDEHRPGQGHTVVRLQQHTVVEGQHGHPVSGLHAESAQQARLAVDPIVEFSVGPLPIAIDDCPAVGKQHGAALEEPEGCQWLHGRCRRVDHPSFSFWVQGSGRTGFDCGPDVGGRAGLPARRASPAVTVEDGVGGVGTSRMGRDPQKEKLLA